jgi:phage-related protein
MAVMAVALGPRVWQRYPCLENIPIIGYIVSGKKEVKPLFWVGSSKNDLREFPEDVQDSVGYALHQAQIGEKHKDAKPLRGFDGASVLEVVEDYGGDTYRAVYTVKFAGAVYVVHAFQKKSRRGSETPKADMDLIKLRLKKAEEQHAENIKTGKIPQRKHND